jgi:putative endonuclease
MFMQCVYVLQSRRDRKFYVGYTSDIKKRLQQHADGVVMSTKNRRPFKLVYYECCVSQNDATTREKYLKSAWGKRYIKNRLKNYLLNNR